LLLSRSDSQKNPIKAHSQPPEKHHGSQISSYPGIELERKRKRAVAADKIINHCAQKHVHQAALHFLAAFPVDSGGQSNLGNLFAAKRAAIQAWGYRFSAIGARTRTHCLP
jgi:hypothetical protein